MRYLVGFILLLAGACLPKPPAPPAQHVSMDPLVITAAR